MISDNDWSNPRLCDYDGRHYCTSCHWQEEAIIPARVLLHWDFTRWVYWPNDKYTVRLLSTLSEYLVYCLNIQYTVWLISIPVRILSILSN